MTPVRLADELRSLAERAEQLADRVGRTPMRRDEQTASEAFAALVPLGVRLYASRASDGRWWWYLVMPVGWRPADENTGRRWLTNPSTAQRWDSGVAAQRQRGLMSSDDPENTERHALLAGLARLTEAVR